MLSLLKFSALANLAALLLVGLCYWLIPFINQMKVIDLLFLTGVFFWLVSSIVRISTKRFKKEWNKHEVTVTDPQLVLQSDNLATRFLVAGAIPIAATLVWGVFY